MGRRLFVRNCTFRNVDDGLHCQPQARGLVAIDCKFTNELRACAAYLDAMQDVVILGFNAVGSVCEHIIRSEGAQNVLVAGCDVDNHDGKETIAIRMGSNVSIIGNTLRLGPHQRRRASRAQRVVQQYSFRGQSFCRPASRCALDAGESRQPVGCI